MAGIAGRRGNWPARLAAVECRSRKKSRKRIRLCCRYSLLPPPAWFISYVYEKRRRWIPRKMQVQRRPVVVVVR